jgi:hypothetical protein
VLATSRDGSDWFFANPIANAKGYKSSMTFQIQEVVYSEVSIGNDGSVGMKSMKIDDSLAVEPHGNLRLTFYTPGDQALHSGRLRSLLVLYCPLS